MLTWFRELIMLSILQMLKQLPRDTRRRLTGWLLSALTALVLTSEPVRDLSALPDSLHLTRGNSASLTLPGLIEADIEIHGQIVLCPHLNDGEELKKTLALFPGSPRDARPASPPRAL